jgi:hypothetical protein
LSFFDEGDDPRTAIRSPQPQPRRPPDRGRRSSTDDRTLLLRRAAAAGIVLVVLIALVLGIKALLNHQAVQGLKDYNNKVAGLVGSGQGEQALVREPFFAAIVNAFNSANPSQVAITIQGEVHQEQLYYQEAQGWSVPAQMVGAQRQFVQTLGLRYEALQAIAAEMPSALGSTNGSTSDQGTAITDIAGNMQLLLASDVIYAERVAPLITQALNQAGITGQTVAASSFLPDISWLNPQTLAQRILGFVPTSLGGGTLAPGQSNGHELVGVSVQGTSGDTPLQSGTTTINRYPYTSAGVTFVLTVKNSGNGVVHDVQTEIYFHKTGLDTSCLKSTSQIPVTSPGQSYTSSIVFAPSSCTNLSAFYNQALEMTAEVVPVRGETDKANNFLHYLVEFTH